jgi:hypothetical protein
LITLNGRFYLPRLSAGFFVEKFFNTDQSSQFTRSEFTRALREADARIVKHEGVYLQEIETEANFAASWWPTA